MTATAKKLPAKLPLPSHLSGKNQTTAAPWLRCIACITTSRADSGIYRPLLEALAKHDDWTVKCLAGGTHLSDSFGRTIDELRSIHGISVTPVDHHCSGDRARDVAESAGRAITEFARTLDAERPDLVFVLGDRTEMLAASLAALVHGVPMAHLHGGDVTEGAYDDQCRHAITKMSHLHFPAHAEHARRIMSMGEEPWRVVTAGALALDALAGFEPDSLDKLAADTGLALNVAHGRPFIVVVYHPETLSPMPAARQIDELLAALAPLDANLLLVGPNADVGRDAVAVSLAQFAKQRPGRSLVASLPQQRFWSALAHAQLVVGNSSAGILEAATLKVPVVNVGQRQHGRIRAANVIDAPINATAISTAIARALEPSFRRGFASLINPYGDGHAAERIVETLRALPDRQTMLHKPWRNDPTE